MKASVLFAAAAVLLIMGMGTTEKTIGEKAQFYGFEATLVRYTYDSLPLIHKGDLLFPKGLKTLVVKAAEMRTLFPDSTYPLGQEFKNDAADKSKIGIPTGKKRYSVCEVEPILLGRATQRWLINGGSVLGSYSFHFEKTGYKGMGLVRIKDTDMYYIMPL